VQGQLRQQPLSVEIETACQHCGRPLRLALGSDMQFTVHEPEAAPLVFMPDVDWANFAERTIIDSY
jgi:hypothetical protein